MINGERVVAVVTARAGSKSVPGKNLRQLGGRPLVVWPIDVARAVPEIDRIIVSTDGQDIARTAEGCGAEVLIRPAALASDTSMVADVLRHVIAELRAAGETARYLVLLEPTSPLRRAADVTACLRKLHDERLDSVATFMEASLNPNRAWRLENGRPVTFIDGAVPWLPRQALPRSYQLTGSAYAFVMDSLPDDSPGLLFGRSGAVLVDRLRAIDIDDELDFTVADAILRSGLLADP